ncbi:hypothetical protein Pmani_021138 [Petrolisthes manimaculis]|uniref:Acyl-CoA synthetase family member 3, mitochondrial n=1 Tax=Petrolisthes manimaculis TaxID=1843537 RepID=A0AAE1U5S4_9EUCA|nr:hypothetical protein Pmani_021138 [Petrolisthes manimaculis]
MCLTFPTTHSPIYRQWQHKPYKWLQSRTATTDVPLLPVFRKATQYGDKVALTDQHGEHTYEQIHKLSGHLAWLMQSVLGHDKVQQRVVALCPNDVSYVITQWATWMAGHVAVPLYPRHPASELEYFVHDSDAAIIVTTSEYASKVKPILSGQQVIILEEFFFKPSNPKDETSPLPDSTTPSVDSQAPPVPPDLEPPSTTDGRDNEFYAVSDAMIIYTSGTTGPPKGVLLSHPNLASQVWCLLQAWGMTSRDTLLHCLPLHHTHGIVNALLCPLHVGARVVMLQQFSPSEVWTHLLSLDTPVEARVNIFMAVPTMYAKLIHEYDTRLAQTSRMQEYVRSVCAQNIRLMVSGSAALPTPVLERWQAITGHVLLERYGMTEIGMALSNPLKGARKPGFVGNPLPGVEVRVALFQPGREEYEVLCEGTNQATVITPGQEDQPGELLVRGANVFQEYWKKSLATQKEFTHDGWFRTGDTALYSEGSYRILGRTSVDIIKSGGFKISALEVERGLLAHPDIMDVAVVGVPDLTWGQKVAAVVVWCGEGELDTVELRTWGKERMPHYQVPSLVVACPSDLPRNNMGKVNKKQLIQDYFPEATAAQN